MNKSVKITLWIILFFIILIISFFIFKHETWELENQYKKICCNNKCFDIEIADNKESRELWLMYREDLSDNNWMFFIFDNLWIHSFWMKNTLIPLAWIRLDSNLEIVDIILMDPCKTEECPIYTPQSDAKYVLEINQWLVSEEWLLNTWDKCELK
jgi:uncharacterized membrane protein (UPF0127 family)